jgi:hypothetical protein
MLEGIGLEIRMHKEVFNVQTVIPDGHEAPSNTHSIGSFPHVDYDTRIAEMVPNLDHPGPKL